MVPSPVGAALVDVGGTLWPDSWPISAAEMDQRLAAISAVFSQADPARLAGLIAAITSAVEEGMGLAPRREAAETIAEYLETYGFPADATTVSGVRQALAVHLGASVTTYPGAADLLAGIKDLGLVCVILSNTTFRDAELYARDFETLGWSSWIDACVTSVDAGCRKPDPGIFQMALRAAGCPAGHCVMIGDSEDADIVPAMGLGMRTIRIVHNSATESAADATASSLAQVLETVRLWANR